jgi:hypothetical protein
MGELSIGEELVEVLSDRVRSITDRIAAAERLADDDSPATMRALIRVAQNADLPDALASAVGASLGRICFRRSQDVDELVMADFSGPAYLGYDKEVARLLLLAPHVKMRRAV